MAREYRYLLLDVFTETPLMGNQLAVFLDGDGLTDSEMQALARETNLSETTFCFPRQGPLEQGVRVRIFTTDEELPFAGHPTLGTANALRWAFPVLHGASVVKLRLNVGIVLVRFPPANGAEGVEAGGHAHRQDGLPGNAQASPETGEQHGKAVSEQAYGQSSELSSASIQASANLPFGQPAWGEMEQPLPWFGQRHDAHAVAEALGVPWEAIDHTKPIETVSTGIPFVVVSLASQEALRTLAVPQQAAQRYLSGTDGKFFYVIAPGTDVGIASEQPITEWQARMQFYSGEDPATGSAAGCATAYLVHHGYAPAGTPLMLRQGMDMGRPSALHCQAMLLSASQRDESGVTGKQSWDMGSYVRVGGSTVLVAEGRFFLF